MYKKEKLEQEKMPVIRNMFWLNSAKPEHEMLLEIIVLLKRKRQFAPSVRLGLQLVWALQQGDIDVLLKHFPFVVDAIAEQEFLPELQAERAKLDAEWRRLDLYLAGQTNSNSNMPQGSMLHPISPNVEADWLNEEDDIEIELEIKEVQGDGKQASQNFIQSIMNLSS